MGTKDGWHYIYPIHEAPVNDRTATQGEPAALIRYLVHAGRHKPCQLNVFCDLLVRVHQFSAHMPVTSPQGGARARVQVQDSSSPCAMSRSSSSATPATGRGSNPGGASCACFIWLSCSSRFTCIAASPACLHPHILPCRTVWVTTQPFGALMGGLKQQLVLQMHRGRPKG